MKHFKKKHLYTLLATLFLITAVYSGVVYAKDLVLRNNAITSAVAKHFAFVDAGVTENEASNIFVEFDREDGIYVYEIDFFANGKKYTYEIDAADGSIISKKYKRLYSVTKNAPKKTPQKKADSPYFNIEDAKTAILKHAGVDRKDATFESSKIEHERGFVFYEIEFFTANNEYDYEVDAYTGQILKSSREPRDLDDRLETIVKPIRKVTRPVKNIIEKPKKNVPVYNVPVKDKDVKEVYERVDDDYYDDDYDEDDYDDDDYDDDDYDDDDDDND